MVRLSLSCTLQISSMFQSITEVWDRSLVPIVSAIRGMQFFQCLEYTSKVMRAPDRLRWDIFSLYSKEEMAVRTESRAHRCGGTRKRPDRPRPSLQVGRVRTRFTMFILLPVTVCVPMSFSLAANESEIREASSTWLAKRCFWWRDLDRILAYGSFSVGDLKRVARHVDFPCWSTW